MVWESMRAVWRCLGRAGKGLVASVSCYGVFGKACEWFWKSLGVSERSLGLFGNG